MTRLKITAAGMVVWLSAAPPAAAQARPATIDPPTFLIGDFVDDYGISYSISRESWSQGRDARYEIVEWDVGNRRIIARNASDNVVDAGLWMRIDWVVLDAASDGYRWAFCYAVYDAPTREAAAAGPATSPETPRTGCNGFPFSRMRRVGGPVAVSSAA